MIYFKGRKLYPQCILSLVYTRVMRPKDYVDWMEVKRVIHNNNAAPVGMKERDIWLCSIGENIGFEEDGKGHDFVRPVLLLKVYNREFCHIVPLSTTSRRGRFYFPFDGTTGKISVALLSQSRPIASARLHEKIGYISLPDFQILKKKLAETLGL